MQLACFKLLLVASVSVVCTSSVLQSKFVSKWARCSSAVFTAFKGTPHVGHVPANLSRPPPCSICLAPASNIDKTGVLLK